MDEEVEGRGTGEEVETKRAGAGEEEKGDRTER